MVDVVVTAEDWRLWRELRRGALREAPGAFGGQAHLQGWVETGEELHAPAVLPYEVANVLARLVFDGDLGADGIADTWSDLAALDVVLHPFDLTQDGSAVGAITTQLRRRHATDSTYIHLAQQLDTAVRTLDGPLARNAADVGLPVKLIT